MIKLKGIIILRESNLLNFNFINEHFKMDRSAFKIVIKFIKAKFIIIVKYIKYQAWYFQMEFTRFQECPMKGINF